jgi:hypothetical protein
MVAQSLHIGTLTNFSTHNFHHSDGHLNVVGKFRKGAEMKNKTLLALAIALTVGAASARADVGDGVKRGGDVFAQDANAFGKAVKGLSNDINNEILSGSTQIVTGPTGQTIMIVGDVTKEAATAISDQYDHSRNALRCVSNDPLNPFQDSGCIVQYGGRTLILTLNVAADGTQTLIVGAADVLSQVFDGFSRVMLSAAQNTGELNTPVGAFFLLTYHITKGGETVLRFAMVDVVGRSALVLVDEGADLVVAPIDAMYDVVTLHWKRAGVKIINLPLKAINAVVNIPLRIIFGEKSKDFVSRTVSPLGRLINNTLGIDDNKANELNHSRAGLDRK